MIKLRKTVIVGAVYDDCVSAGDVYSVFNDRGGHQHIVLITNEIKHDALHFFFVHLAVADRHARLRHQTLDQRGNGFDRLDTIVNEKDLSAAREFQLDGRLDYRVR